MMRSISFRAAACAVAPVSPRDGRHASRLCRTARGADTMSPPSWQLLALLCNVNTQPLRGSPPLLSVSVSPAYSHSYRPLG